MGYLNGEGVFTINCSGESYVCTPDNTAAYVHDERFKDADHIFRHTFEEDDPNFDPEVETGIFVFRALFGVVFNPLVQDMEELGFTVIHQDEPSDLDWHQFAEFSMGDVDKYWEVLDGTQ